MLNDSENQVKKMRKVCNTNEQAQLASYKIAQLLVKSKKPHTDGEKIIAPSLKIATEIMIGKEAAEKIKNIPLSAATISRRIQDMSQDISIQISENFEKSNEVDKIWSLQVDESTDISGKAQLIAFIRFIRQNQMTNEYLFCKDLRETTTGEDIFVLVDQEIKMKKLEWKYCVGVCTDGAPAMQGNRKGFVTLVKRENPEVIIIHCMIHREALVSKCLPDQLSETLTQVVQVVNYIKANPLRSRTFYQLCDAIDSEFKSLLYHTEVRWLSKGKVLNRVVFLKIEIISFLDTEDTEFSFIHDEIWWTRVTFLSNLFEKLNELNLSLQGPKENIITLTSKLESFSEKINLWLKKIKTSDLSCFAGLNDLPRKNEIKADVLSTLGKLRISFEKYFPSLNTKQYQWILNPFASYDEIPQLTLTENEELLDLKNDFIHKSTFKINELESSWISLRTEFPNLAQKAIRMLICFGSSYLCELAFSAMVEIKSKKRERILTLDEELRVCLSKIEPRINYICKQRQSHVSH